MGTFHSATAKPRRQRFPRCRMGRSAGWTCGVASQASGQADCAVLQACGRSSMPASRCSIALLVDLMKIEHPSVNLELQSLASIGWTSGLEFLNALDFRHIESELGMRCSELVPYHRNPPFPISMARVTHPPTYAADLARIHNAAYEHDAAFRSLTTPEMSRTVDGDELWIACHHSRVVAFCHLELEPKMVWLESLAVLPEYQGNGLGTALVQRALKAMGVGADRPAALNVSSQNPRAVAVYSNIGFVPRGEMRRFSASRSDVIGALTRRARPRDP